jgi:hypothetical protein
MAESLSNDLHVSSIDVAEHNKTGILVRARMSDDTWGNADIAELDRISLMRWLRSRGGTNLWAENTVLQLLGWPGYLNEGDVQTALDGVAK